MKKTYIALILIFISSLFLNANAIEDEIVRLINLERSKSALPPLPVNNRLNSLALYHSDNMAKNNFLSNIDLEGLNSQGRQVKLYPEMVGTVSEAFNKLDVIPFTDKLAAEQIVKNILSSPDYKRFVSKTNITKEGELADKKVYSLNNKLIEKEEKFDGFYGVCTNLEDGAEEIIKINKRRWEIEECFRIMKSEFKARPVYLSREDRILAHFTTCFLSLVIYRFLEKRLEEKYTCNEIIETLRDMNLNKVNEIGYIPTYTRTDITDSLHEKFNFRTDYEILENKEIKKILRKTKK